MKIQNIRYGFATNSSSSHSIVIINGGAKETPPDDDQEFGWEEFTLSSYERKLEYFGQILKVTFQYVNKLEREEAALLASNWLGIEVQPDGHIDHQSQFRLPRAYGTNMPCRRFVTAIKEELSNDNLVILGGNDNSEGHPLAKGAKEAPGFKELERDVYGADWVIRHDDIYDYWVLFNTRNGTKMRFNFHDHTITRAATPELVDLKITNQCSRGCKYCYQNSTPTGTHADTRTIFKIACLLEQLQVFEVAIGGGEPTEHPKFFEILETFKDHHVVPNFSTRNVKFVKDHMSVLRLLGVGGVGISVDNSKEAVEAMELFEVEEQRSDGPALMLHHVVGLTPPDDLIQIMELAKKMSAGPVRAWGADNWASLPLLLLGYKVSGRGNKYVPQEFDIMKILEEYDNNHYYSVGVDTVLVNQHQNALAKISNPIYWTAGEGLFSFYIDAVSDKMGNCSYDPPSLMFPAVYDTREFKEMYSLTPDERTIKEIV